MSKETFKADLKMQASMLFDHLRKIKSNPESMQQYSELDDLVFDCCVFLLDSVNSLVDNCEHSYISVGESLIKRISAYASLSVRDRIFLIVTFYRFFYEHAIVVPNYVSGDRLSLCATLKEYIERYETDDSLLLSSKYYVLNIFPVMLVDSRVSGQFNTFTDEHQKIIKELSKYKDSDAKVSEVLTQLATWDQRTNENFKRVDALNIELKNLSSSYNFANISHGFQNLLNSKKSDLNLNSTLLLILSLVLVCPPIAAIYVGVDFEPNVYKSSSYYISALVSYIPFVVLDFFILYFFRISLSTRKEIATQIVQLELRKSLCQFIESYSEKSKEMSATTPKLLEKFETLIFSGLTTDPANIPTTFDGFEQLANTIKSFKSQ